MFPVVLTWKKIAVVRSWQRLFYNLRISSLSSRHFFSVYELTMDYEKGIFYGRAIKKTSIIQVFFPSFFPLELTVEKKKMKSFCLNIKENIVEHCDYGSHLRKRACEAFYEKFSDTVAYAFKWLNEYYWLKELFRRYIRFNLLSLHIDQIFESKSISIILSILVLHPTNAANLRWTKNSG